MVTYSSSLLSSIVRVDKEKIDDDHLILSCNLSYELSGKTILAQPKYHRKLNWDPANVPLYLATLTALLSTIKVPYHLLQTLVSSPSSGPKLLYIIKLSIALNQLPKLKCLWIKFGLVLGSLIGTFFLK